MLKQVRARFNGSKIEYNNNGLASQGFTTARIIEVPISEFEVKVEIGKRLGEIFKGTDIAGNRSIRKLGMGIRLGEYAINGNLANTNIGQPFGYVVINGKIVVDTFANQHWSALIVWNDGRVTIEKIDRSKVKDMKYAVSCTPVIAKDGKIHVTSWVDKTPADMMIGSRRPRTVIGIKGDKIIGAVIDGDSSQNAGMSVDHVSALLLNQGATDLINMDGGGSSSVIKIATQSQNNKNTTPLYKVEVTASALNIRNLPTTSGSTVLGTYRQGEVVDVFEESGIWQRTNRGWISRNFTRRLQNTWKGWRITSPYGNRISPISGRQEMHTGVDLADYHRKPIESFTGGTVIRAEFGRAGTGYGGFGNIVAVRDDKFRHEVLYAHLDSIGVKQGDIVKVGDIVGTQGATGNVTGSHLHFEVRPTGFPSHIDPIAFIERYEKQPLIKRYRLTVDGKTSTLEESKIIEEVKKALDNDAKNISIIREV